MKNEEPCIVFRKVRQLVHSCPTEGSMTWICIWISVTIKPEHFAPHEATNFSDKFSIKKTLVAISGQSQTVLKLSKRDPGLTRRRQAVFSSEVSINLVNRSNPFMVIRKKFCINILINSFSFAFCVHSSVLPTTCHSLQSLFSVMMSILAPIQA